VRWIATRSGAEKLVYAELLSLSAVLLTSEQFGLDAYDVASDVAREMENSALSSTRSGGRVGAGLQHRSAQDRDARADEITAGRPARA
jgi:hypothetical protein